MSNLLRDPSIVLSVAACVVSTAAVADSRPDILHYRFSGTGPTTPNLASNPPPFSRTAFIGGGLVQTGADLNLRGDGHSLVASGAQNSVTDFVNTQ